MRLLKRCTKKLKSNRGFTLLEMLVALAIVVMLSLMMSVGSSVGAQVQRESTFVAQSDILASTINTALGDVLRYSDVTLVDELADGTEPSPNEAYKYESILTNEAGQQLLINNDGYGVSGGALVLDTSRDSVPVALKQNEKIATTDGDGNEILNDQLKTYYLVSHGVYTNLTVMNDDDHPFTLKYVEPSGTTPYYEASYWISEKNGSKPMKKEVKAYFRIVNE